MVNDSKHLVFRFSDFELREREHRLLRAGEEIHLQPQVFRLLLYLVHNRDRVVQKDEILRDVWDSAAVTDNSLTRSISLLRKILDGDPRDSGAIRTVSSIGYQFVCAVEQAEDRAASSKLAEVATEESAKPEIPEIPAATLAEDKNRIPRGFNRMTASVLGLSVLLATGLWYLHRPVPPLRVTGYTQLTHDGFKKSLAGTDGGRLYINQSYENDLFFDSSPPGSISQVAISGGGIAQIPVGVPGPKLVDVSADGSSLLIFSVLTGEKPAKPLWNVRTLGDAARRLGEAVDASFSPDGNLVAYSTPEGDIWLERNDGTGTHKLGSPGGSVFGISWSPDGGIIRFNKDDAIWEMSSSGSNPHPLFPSWDASFSNYWGRWTPDGKLFVFMAQPKGQFDRGEIWALDEQREIFRPPAQPVQLAGGPTIWGRPIPGKDGKTIFAEGQKPRGELSRFDTHTKQFQTFLGGISAQGATFSRDGKYVAYVSFPESILWKAKRDGSNPVQLSDRSMFAFLPRWSPDGTQIAFAACSASGGDDYYRVYLVSSDGGSPPKRLTDVKESWNFPYWSPDGRKITFNAWTVDNSVVENGIRILDLEGHQVTTVPGSVGMIAPRWSPDGRYLSSATDGGLNLKIFDFKTRQWSEIVQKGPVDSPEWSRDGQYIYFRRVRGDPGVFRISIKGGEAEKIVDLRHWHDAGWYGRYMGLDPTDAPLLLRDIGSDDIYALTVEAK